VTPSVTATNTPTPTLTPTNTLTPTPSNTPAASAQFNGQIDYEDCVNCSGTITTPQLPKPAWSDNQGAVVYQTDAVALGGPNGLNS
jgi:hypothetical protein